ncbi:MAG TPA: TlpA family protein disulfide reductase [Actinobacteria bacterium]|nr:thiol:disulfide interchange protein DsbE [bacterium BMS3Bbin02]HDL41879.1 TlpA family protein disulfide reductase [Actinomycetota bacterium]
MTEPDVAGGSDSDPTIEPTEEPRQGKMGIVVSVLFVGAVVFFAMFASKFGQDQLISASPLIGRTVPATALPYLERSGELSLTEYDGDIIVLNFWASWCPPCRLEQPDLVRAADELSDLGVTFVGVLFNDDAGAGSRFLDTYGRSDRAHYVLDDRSLMAFDFGVIGLPETFFIDRQGVIQAKISGGVSYELLVATIEQMILGNTPESVKTGELQTRN